MTSGSSTWDEGGILELIRDQVPENLTLDYKRAAALDKSESKKAEISKDASAFANSAGGVLVYGVAEIDQVPTHIDGGVDPSDISREWLENVINSRIQPRIDGIVIHPIPLTISYPGRVIYVVS